MPAHKLSKEKEDAITKMLSEGFSVIDIVCKIGVSSTTVALIRKRTGITYSGKYRKINSAELGDIASMLRDMVPVSEICLVTGRGEYAIRRVKSSITPIDKKEAIASLRRQERENFRYAKEPCIVGQEATAVSNKHSRKLADTKRPPHSSSRRRDCGEGVK